MIQVIHYDVTRMDEQKRLQRKSQQRLAGTLKESLAEKLLEKEKRLTK